jgi:SH3 domain-containing protein
LSVVFVGLSSRAFIGALLGAALLVSSSEARDAVLKDKGRLREGPGGASPLLGEVPPGTHVDVTGESGGWRKVTMPDGRTGYIWAEHLVEPPADGQAAEPARRSDAPAEPARRSDTPAAPVDTGSRALLDEVRDLRADIAALRDRPAPTMDVDKLRSEVDRLTQAQRELLRRLDERASNSSPLDPPPDALPGAGWLGLAGGVIVGWILSRLAQRRGDRRQRSRIRL